MSSLWKVIDEASSLSEEDKEKLQDAAHCEKEEEWRRQELQELRDRVRTLEISVTELRSKVFQIPLQYDSEGLVVCSVK